MFLFGTFGDDNEATNPFEAEWVFTFSGRDIISNVYLDDRVFAGPGDDVIVADDDLVGGTPVIGADGPVIFGGLGEDTFSHNNINDGVDEWLFGFIKRVNFVNGESALLIGVENVDDNPIG